MTPSDSLNLRETSKLSLLKEFTQLLEKEESIFLEDKKLELV
jgi:hypothetical protein